MIWQNTKVRIAIIASLVLLAIIAYRIYGNIQANNERANRVSQGQNIAVATSFPQRQRITPVMRFAGSLDPVWQADVAAKIDGRVEKVYVNEGDKVTAGTVLAHLEQTEQTANLLSAKGSLMDAQTTLERAERELQRYQALYEKGAVSEQTVDNYRFARNNAQGKLSEAQGVWDNMQDKLSGASVTAPQDGIISKRYYQEGYYAKVGTALFNIADISELTAKINIPEGQISNIAVGGLADITVPAYPDDKFSGMITRISPKWPRNPGSNSWPIRVAPHSTARRSRCRRATRSAVHGRSPRSSSTSTCRSASSSSTSHRTARTSAR